MSDSENTEIGGDEDAKTLVIGDISADDASSGTVGVLDTLTVKPQSRYRFIRSIGFGGMKSVLLVHDADTRRDVAMAIMPDFRERPRCELEHFVGEALLTARLEHPNIVPVHDIGVDASGSPYFTMKYLRGMSLSSVIRKLRRNDPETVERYTTARLLQVFIRICNAIEFAHSQGVCHLDLKPENVNIGDFGEVLVLDWGLACTTEEARKLSQSTGDKLKISGTPGYMAPEQIRRSASRPIGPLADIYALGGILHAMLVLNSPLHKLPLEEALRRTVSGDVPAPSEVAPVERYVPVALDAICRKAMAADPRQRYATVRELREDIFAFQTGYVPKAENASALKYAGLFIGRNLLIFFILLSLVLATALALAIYY